MPAGVIQVSPELLRSKASEIRTLKAQHDEAMAKMKTLIYSLNEQWKGEAQTAFVQKFDSMQGTFTNFSELIEGYARMMDTTANSMTEVDANLTNTINSFGV